MSNQTNCGIILLSAGRGSRMRPLTENIPKSLLQVGEKRVLDWLIDALLPSSQGEIVVVTGHAADEVNNHVAQRYGDRVTTVYNAQFEEDVNILSVHLGVEALKHPERGYLIIETDLLLDDQAWEQVINIMHTKESWWVCHNSYHAELTGGIVHVDKDGWVDSVEYQPMYDKRYEGWPKMVGMLLVGPEQVVQDRRIRQTAIEDTIAQYYLQYWQQGLSSLPCKSISLHNCFARSFNTKAEYEAVSADFLKLTQVNI